METCEMGVVKYILFIFNLVFAISGIGIITAGAVVLSDVGDFNHFMSNELLAPPIVLIVVGAIVFIVAFLGCFGAIRESYNILIAFAVCLLIIFVAELAVGIAAAVYKSDFGDAMKSTLKKSMANYSQNDVEKIAWDNAHNKLLCCGVEGPNDWVGQQLPYSCCHINEELATQNLDAFCIGAAKGKYVYQEGCYNKLKAKVNSNSSVLIGIGIGIAFIEILGIILACWLAQTIKREGGEEK